MQLVSGSRVLPTTVDAIVTWTQNYEYVALDLGTGDGRCVATRAQRSPRAAVIGVDLCAANMASSSRKASVNARFLVADAILLPTEMIEVADQVTIAFPWGSLLRDILGNGDTLVTRLVRTMRPGAKVEIVINADAALSCGMALSAAQTRIVTALATRRSTRVSVASLDERELKAWPSTWAKRLAFGRDPHAIAISTSILAEPGRCPGGVSETVTLYHHVQDSTAAMNR